MEQSKEDIARQFAEYLGKAFEQFSKIIADAVNYCYERYKDAGLPYGNNLDGLILWVGEQNRHTEHLDNRTN